MRLVTQEFNERVDEIKHYLDFVEEIDRGSMRILSAEDDAPAYSSNQRQDLVRTLKASTLLMLYNLMESSVTNAIEAIFDELSKEPVSFDRCREEIRLVVLGNLRQHNPEKLLPNLKVLATDIVTKTFRKNDIASGNLDARKIREVARGYGFPAPQCRGDRLLNVKADRNDLAHGSKSFAQVGRDYSVGDIVQIFDDVVRYLTELLDNVSEYLRARDYLSTEVHTPET